MADNEQWKDVKGLEQYCSISSNGVLKMKSRHILKGKYSFLRKEKILTPSLHKNKRYYYQILIEGQRYSLFVHLLVANHFVRNSNKNKFKDVLFIDGNIKNWCASNLKWCSHSDLIKIVRGKTNG
jgi:hypothetical protein